MGWRTDGQNGCGINCEMSCFEQYNKLNADSDLDCGEEQQKAIKNSDPNVAIGPQHKDITDKLHQKYSDYVDENGYWKGDAATDASLRDKLRNENSDFNFVGNSDCGEECQNGCAACDTICGKGCQISGDNTCGCNNSGCTGGCSGNCTGSCSGSCDSSCSGGCQGSCKTSCDVGCSSQEQLDNITELDKIVRAPNIQDIFKFIIYEAEKRRNKKIPTSYKTAINNLKGWTQDQEDSLMLLYYNIPRIFERTFKNILEQPLTNIQSGSLNPNDNFAPYFPEIDEIQTFKMTRSNNPSYNDTWLQWYRGPGGNLDTRPGYGSDFYLPPLGSWLLTALFGTGEEYLENLNKHHPSGTDNPYYPNDSSAVIEKVEEDEEIPEEPPVEEEPGIDNSEGFKYYTDRFSAQEWVDKAMALYNEIIPHYDAR